MVDWGTCFLTFDDVVKEDDMYLSIEGQSKYNKYGPYTLQSYRNVGWTKVSMRNMFDYMFWKWFQKHCFRKKSQGPLALSQLGLNAFHKLKQGLMNNTLK